MSVDRAPVYYMRTNGEHKRPDDLRLVLVKGEVTATDSAFALSGQCQRRFRPMYE
jgi:hypothetical protein